MKKALVSLALLFTTTAFGSGQFGEVSCWDGSFGYNTFSVKKEAGRVILGVAGSQLGPIDFESSHHEHLDVPEWGDVKNAMFFTLDESHCVEDEDKIECTAPRPRHGLFIRKFLRDLEDNKEIITPVYLEAVSFSVERTDQSFEVEAIISEFGNQISLSKTFPNFSMEPDKPCSQLGSGNFNESSKPPKRLLNFLKNN